MCLRSCGGEKRNVLIVSVLLPIAVNFTLRSKTQRRIEVLGMRYQTLLLHVATAPNLNGRGSWTGRRPGSGGPLRLGGSCGSQRRRAVGLRLPLHRAACGPCVRPCGTSAPTRPLASLVPWLHLSAGAGAVAVKVHVVFFATALSKRVDMVAGERKVRGPPNLASWRHRWPIGLG